MSEEVSRYDADDLGDHLTRRYRDQLALDDVTVDIHGPSTPGC